MFRKRKINLKLTSSKLDAFIFQFNTENDTDLFMYVFINIESSSLRGNFKI